MTLLRAGQKGTEARNEATTGQEEFRARVLIWALQRHPLAYGVMAAYAVASTVLMARHDVGVTSEHVLLLCVVGLATVAPARAFVWDWLPFIFVGAMFEDLQPMASRFVVGSNLTGPIDLESSVLGGNVAAVWLQRSLDVAGGLRWYDVVLSVEYLLHFAAPLLMGAWLWWRHRARFGAFVTAYVMIMAAGFVIYLAYPEVPPWLAAERGALPHLDRIVVQVLDGVHQGLGGLYAGADPEPNGAMPALHVSIPVLIAATWWSVYGHHAPSTWLLLLYPVTVSFATIYLGEHYLIDDIVGLGVGLAGFTLAETYRAWTSRSRAGHRADRPRRGAVRSP